MKNHLCFALCLLALLGHAPGAAAGDETPRQETLCSVSGLVIHYVTKRPVENVVVGLGYFEEVCEAAREIVLPYGSSPERFETRSAADGSFTLAGFEPGTRLLLTRDALMAAVLGEIPLDFEAGESEEGVTLLVAEGASVSGTVFDDEYRHGIEGVVVEASETNDERPWERAYGCVTDADGSFRLGGLPMGTYAIGSGPADGFLQSSGVFFSEEPISTPCTPLRWNTHYESVEFTVKVGALVTGHVTDEAGQPIAGADVGRFSGRSLDWCVRTKADGSFVLREYEYAGDVTLVACKDGLVSEVRSASAVAGDTTAVSMVLGEAPTISGRVVSLDGKPLGHPLRFKVTMAYVGGSCSRYEEVETDSGGRFSSGPLVPGSYDFTVWPKSPGEPAWHAAKVTVGFEEHQEVDLPFDVPAPPEGLSVAGRVVDEGGNAIAGATLSTAGANPYATTSDADGRFLLRTEITKDKDPTDAWRFPNLQFFAGAQGYALREYIAKPSTTDFEACLSKGSRIEGQVVDAQTGCPVERFSLKVDVQFQNVMPWLRQRMPRGTDPAEHHPEGRFALGGLSAMKHYLVINASGYARKDHTVKIEHGKDVEGITVKLEPTHALRGVVVDLEGYPLHYALVVIDQKEAKAGIRNHSAFTDGTGAFVVERVYPVAAQLRVHHRAYPEHKEEIRPTPDGFDKLRIVVTDGGTVFGRVTLDGQALAGAEIDLGSGCKTDEDGRFAVARIPFGAGRFEVNYTEGSGLEHGRSLYPTYVMPPEGRVEVNLDFAPGNSVLKGRLLRNEEELVGQVLVSMALPNGEEISVVKPVPADGRFTMKHLPAGEVYVQWCDEDSRKTWGTVLHANKTTELEVDLAAGVTLAGRIEAAHAGEALSVSAYAGVLDTELTKGTVVSAAFGRTIGSFLLEDASFAFHDVPPGTVTLLVRTKGSWPDSADPKCPVEYLAMETVEVGTEDISGISLVLEEPEK